MKYQNTSTYHHNMESDILSHIKFNARCLMKKLILATLCASSVMLVACAKKPEATQQTEQQTQQAAPAPVSFSHDNVADIKADLKAVQELSNKKAQEGVKFQEEAMEAAKSGKEEQIQAMVGKMKVFVDSFNNELSALSLKSAEVNDLRIKMIESNNYGLQLAQESVTKTPDEKKMNDLQKQVNDVQQQMLDIMQKLQAKVGTLQQAASEVKPTKS